ncbi:MAG: hypothetical protein JSW15_03860, partial [Deltaproteobacteria bacterium]
LALLSILRSRLLRRTGAKAMTRQAECTENLFPVLNPMIGIEACDAGILSNPGLICLRDLCER